MTQKEFKSLFKDLLKSGVVRFEVESDIDRDADEVKTNLIVYVDDEEVYATDNRDW
jgi:nitrite reductase/ring-hydroxylating ferredoxin subunit